jgi:nitrogen fixation protein NifU and related proteins
MNELSELYQQVILDHNRQPRNFKKLENANRKSEGYNPLCGDRIVVYLLMEDDVIQNIAFEGSGCAISKASASMMTEILKGKNKNEALDLFDKFRKMITTPADVSVDSDGLGKLAVLSGVREFPVRVKCASLAWHTLNAALQGKADPISTE